MNFFVELKTIFSRKYYSSALFLTYIQIVKQNRGSLLGWVWTLLQPTIQIVIYALVFGTLFKIPNKAHAFYIMTLLLPWLLLNNSIIHSCFSLIHRGESFKRCTVSKTIFPVSDMLRNLHIFFISFVSMYAIGLVFYTDFHWSILFLPIALGPILITALTSSIAISYLNPYFRDLHEFLTPIFMASFYLTPIIYPVSIIPEKYRWLLNYNLFYWLLKPIKNVVYDGVLPQMSTLMISYSTSFVVAILSFLIYKKFKNKVIFYL